MNQDFPIIKKAVYNWANEIEVGHVVKTHTRFDLAEITEKLGYDREGFRLYKLKMLETGEVKEMSRKLIRPLPL